MSVATLHFSPCGHFLELFNTRNMPGDDFLLPMLDTNWPNGDSPQHLPWEIQLFPNKWLSIIWKHISSCQNDFCYQIITPGRGKEPRTGILGAMLLILKSQEHYTCFPTFHLQKYSFTFSFWKRSFIKENIFWVKGKLCPFTQLLRNRSFQPTILLSIMQQLSENNSVWDSREPAEIHIKS